MGKVMREFREREAADARVARWPRGRELSSEEADELIAAHMIGMGVAAALIIGIAGALAVIGRMFV
jgi:hypothetical protein